jgi:hypothetical protein
MTRRTISNAFTRGTADAGQARRAPGSALASMRVTLDPSLNGFLLQMRPMLATDALAALRIADAVLPELEPGGCQNLVLEAIPTEDAVPSLAAFMRRQVAPGAEPEPGRLCVDDETLGHLLALVPLRRLRLARVEGEVEARDAAAMAAAAAAGRSPLSAEMRAVAALEVCGDDAVTAELRSRDQALIMVAENLRHYLAALCDRPAQGFEAPPAALMHELLQRRGLTIRPIETQVYSTFIDIGVCLGAEEPSKPADRSLIYDLPSRSWHGDR